MASRVSVLELRSVRGTGGGPEKTILFGAAQANRASVAVTVCYIRDRRDEIFGIGERAGQLDIDYIEVRERHSFDRRIWKTLASIVRDRRIDIVHAHDYKTDLIALLLARQCGIIPLATAHGWTGQSARERYAYYPADQWLLARFPRVIAVSSEIRALLGQRGTPPERVTVLLNAIDPAAFHRRPERRQPVRAALGYADDDLVIGAVGRLERQKRFDVLLATVQGLAAAHPRIRVAFVGDGRLRGTLMSLAAGLGIGDRCSWLGHRDQVGDLHHAFDLFVQSSEYEGTSNALLEAMAMQTPIVATDVGGTRELAAPGVHASLVPAGDAHALAGAIVDALSRPDAARQRAAAARRRIESDLSFAARTRTLESLYHELVRARGDRPVSPPALSGAAHA